MMAGTPVQSSQVAKPVQSPASALVVARARNRTAPKRKPSTLSDQHAMLRATKAGAAKEEADREKLRFAARRLTEQLFGAEGALSTSLTETARRVLFGGSGQSSSSDEQPCARGPLSPSALPGSRFPPS